MKSIDEMPPKCHGCPYWEVCEEPYICPDMVLNNKRLAQKDAREKAENMARNYKRATNGTHMLQMKW